MVDIYTLAIVLAKRSFQVCAADRGRSVLIDRTFPRAGLGKLLAAQNLGHVVRLIPPICVKLFVKRQKNDTADAAATAESALLPNIHYVAVKSAEHQARAEAFRTHQCFVKQHTQLINALRGHLAEIGLIVAQGPANLKAVAGMEGYAIIQNWITRTGATAKTDNHTYRRSFLR